MTWSSGKEGENTVWIVVLYLSVGWEQSVEAVHYFFLVYLFLDLLNTHSNCNTSEWLQGLWLICSCDLSQSQHQHPFLPSPFQSGSALRYETPLSWLGYKPSLPSKMSCSTRNTVAPKASCKPTCPTCLVGKHVPTQLCLSHQVLTCNREWSTVVKKQEQTRKLNQSWLQNI